MGNVSDRKLAVITGASSGIGLELARQCASHGFDVLVCAEDALVAKRGFEAMMDGKDSVLGGGFKSRLQGLANELLPETVKQVSRMSEPGSAKH